MFIHLCSALWKHSFCSLASPTNSSGRSKLPCSYIYALLCGSIRSVRWHRRQILLEDPSFHVHTFMLCFVEAFVLFAGIADKFFWKIQASTFIHLCSALWKHSFCSLAS